MIVSQFERLVASASKSNKCSAWNTWRRRNPKEKIDLSHANLSCQDLRGANLVEADLTAANLRCANLSGAWLMHATLDSASTTSWYCGQTRFGNSWEAEDPDDWVAHDDDPEHGFTDLRAANFEDANLGGATMRCVAMRSAQFEDADMTHVFLFGAIADEANFRGAKLNGVKFWNSRLCGAQFAGARMDAFDDVHGACFHRSNLTGVALSGVIGLADASFRGARLDRKTQAVVLAAMAETFSDAD